MTVIVAPLAGGALIGLAAALLMLLNGRIAGISGIVAGLAAGQALQRGVNGAFVGGLMLAAPVWCLATGVMPDIHVTDSGTLLLAGGLLVGIGTRLGSGCTSGHGVCGLARLSHRSLAAVAVFMTTAMVTVALMRMAGQ
jgi:hypothetical protein